LASELDPFVDRGRGHTPGLELLVKLFRDIRNSGRRHLAVREFS
jgi:hypothetical protein